MKNKASGITKVAVIIGIFICMAVMAVAGIVTLVVLGDTLLQPESDSIISGSKDRIRAVEEDVVSVNLQNFVRNFYDKGINEDSDIEVINDDEDQFNIAYTVKGTINGEEKKAYTNYEIPEGEYDFNESYKMEQYFDYPVEFCYKYDANEATWKELEKVLSKFDAIVYDESKGNGYYDEYTEEYTEEFDEDSFFIESLSEDGKATLYEINCELGEDLALSKMWVYDEEKQKDYYIQDKKLNEKYVQFLQDIYKSRTVKPSNQGVLSTAVVDVFNNKMYIAVNIQDVVNCTVDVKIKSTLTAKDTLFSSNKIKIYKKYGNAVIIIPPVVFVLALIVFVLLLVKMCRFAGYDAEGNKKLSVLAGIPYEIVILAGLAPICLVDANTYSFGKYWALYVLFVEAILLLEMLIERYRNQKVGDGLLIVRFYKKVVAPFTKYIISNINYCILWLGLFALYVFINFVTIRSQSDGMAAIWLATTVLVAIVIAYVSISTNKVSKSIKTIAEGDINHKVDTEKMYSIFKQMGNNLNSISDGLNVQVEEKMKSERMKTELITNVSHDIKTPLTSIISYTDLLDKEIQKNPDLKTEQVDEYIEVLKRQSERMKKLIQDIMDASKAASGNLDIELTQVDVSVLLEQAFGEHMDKLEERKLKYVVSNKSQDSMAIADGRYIWRVFDNLINNLIKYAQEDSRVYADIEDCSFTGRKMISITIKNISKAQLNITGEELKERFVRGDRSRNTEGSGLGLAIAEDLMKLQGGDMEIIVDGDLFKVILRLGKCDNM